MSKFSHFALNKLYFKWSFNNISRNRGPPFSRINFDQTYFGRFLSGDRYKNFVREGFVRGLCPRTARGIRARNALQPIKLLNSLHILIAVDESQISSQHGNTLLVYNGGYPIKLE